jgi:hypothetical protein
MSALKMSEDLERVLRHEACFLLRLTHCTGEIQIHEYDGMNMIDRADIALFSKRYKGANPPPKNAHAKFPGRRVRYAGSIRSLLLPVDPSHPHEGARTNSDLAKPAKSEAAKS